MQQLISNSANVSINGLSDSFIDTQNKTLTNLKDLLVQSGYKSELDTLSKYLPAVLNKGVQSATSGVIQDPAGSAIGSGQFPKGGGASGAIYNHFSDLKPIPRINPIEAVFNESELDGGRVLHCYSPYLNGSPNTLSDCTVALQALTNAYLNAFTAIRLLPPTPGTPQIFREFGAVPLAGRIFAHNFKNNDLDHLHPGNTVASILIAQSEMIRAGKTVPKLTIYYFDKPVYKAAESVLAELSEELNN